MKSFKSLANYFTPFAHQATATVSTTALSLKAEYWGVLTESGDTANQLSAWSFSGLKSTNCDPLFTPNAFTLFWKLTNSTNTRTVSVYNASGMAAGSLVAQGTSVGDGVITLAEQNSSGLTGSVTVAYTADDTDNGNTVVIVPKAQYAIVTVDTNNVRYWVDNTIPTATDGHLAVGGANVSTIIELKSLDEIMGFRFIRESADGKCSVTYYY